MSVLKASRPSVQSSMQNHYKTNRLISLKALLLIATAFILIGCGGNKKQQQSIEELAQQQVEELYSKGKNALERGNYSFAIDYYQALQASFPFGEYTEQAKLDLIFAYDKTGQIEKAVEAADNFIELYPTHRNVDYAYYMKGVSSFEKKAGRLDKFIKGGRDTIRDPQPYRDSQDAFEELLKRFPRSIYADDSKQRVIYIRNALAKRELAIANFYYDSKTYLAAVNRCKTIIYQYETTPSVEGALILMEKAYNEMGLKELAVSTHEVLITNFPNHQKEPFKKEKKGFFSRLNPF